MTNIEEIADKIYDTCVYAMDYDLMGLTFSAPLLANAIRQRKEEIKDVTEDVFLALKEALKNNVLKLYEKNKKITEKEVTDVIKKMTRDDALLEMEETMKFMTYLDDTLDYTYFKTLLGA